MVPLQDVTALAPGQNALLGWMQWVKTTSGKVSGFFVKKLSSLKSNIRSEKENHPDTRCYCDIFVDTNLITLTWACTFLCFLAKSKKTRGFACWKILSRVASSHKEQEMGWPSCIRCLYSFQDHPLT